MNEIMDVAEWDHEGVTDELLQSYRKVFDLIPVPVLVEQTKEEETKYIFVNRKFREVIGYDLHQLPTQEDWFRYAYPDEVYRKEVSEIWAGKFNQPANGNFQIENIRTRIRLSSGEERWFETKASISTDKFKVLTFIDINDIKAQKRNLQQLNALKDRMIAVISHDLRSPLVSLKGLIGLLADEAISRKEMKQLVATVGKQINHSFLLLEDLLNWAKHRMDSEKESAATFEVGAVIAQCIDIYRLQAREKGVKILFDLSALPVMVHHDRELFKIAIRNLLNNAVKYTRPGGEVAVSYTQRECWVEVLIKDNGIGMSQAQIEAILGSQFISSRPGTARETGSGLGLTLTQEAIAKAKGKLQITSALDVGSTFTVNWPLTLTEEVTKGV